jgi:D-amino-acid dehydrogenase
VTTVVLGGGIVGVSTAYFLAKAGEEVVVVERAPEVALETSRANAGLIAPGHSYTWASPAAPITLLKSLVSKHQALRLRLIPDWRMYTWGLEFLRNCTAERAYLNTSRKVRLSRFSQQQLAEVTAREGLAFDRMSKGLLYLYRDVTAFRRSISDLSVLRDNGLFLDILDQGGIATREPALLGVADQFAGAIYCPSDETGDAHLFTQQLYARCISLGVRFMFNTDVRTILHQGGTVQALDTSHGRIDGDRFVLAAGSHSARLVRPLGYKLPIYPVKGYSVTFPVTDHASAPDVGGMDESALAGWARFGDRLRFTATAEFAGFNTTHRPKDFEDIIATGRRLFPSAADYSQPSYWAGLRPMTPRGTPILGRTRHHNLFLNVGHGHLGWTWSCGTARIVSDIITGTPPDFNLTGLTLADR